MLVLSHFCNVCALDHMALIDTDLKCLIKRPLISRLKFSSQQSINSRVNTGLFGCLKRVRLAAFFQNTCKSFSIEEKRRQGSVQECMCVLFVP